MSAPRAWTATVSNFRAVRRLPDLPELEEIFGLKEMPLGETDVALELRGVPTAVVNGIRRAITDEITGYAFKVPADGFRADQTTDVFMLPQFVNQRIEMTPLQQLAAAQAAAAGLKFELHARNATEAPLTVYAGDLRTVAQAGGASYTYKGALFNPTIELAVLQPGKSLVIEDITVVGGRGHAMFQVAICGCFTHLDLPQHSDDEMRLPTGAAADLSGYKESCLVADPRWHELRFTLQATDAAGARPLALAALSAAVSTIRARLRLIIAAVEGGDGFGHGSKSMAAHMGAAQYSSLTLESGLSEGVVRAPGETHTVGELLRRAVYDTHPDVSAAVYSVSAHEKALTLTVRAAGDVGAIIVEAANMADATLEDILRAIVALD